MKTKQQIIDRIIERWKSTDINSMDKILTEELPDFNPMRIDEERMTNIYKKTGGQKFKISYTQDAVKEYNSTLPSPLVPLPKEMPKEFYDVAKMHSSHGTWQWLLEHYGTPSKEPLPSVEELERELKTLPIKEIDEIKQIAQHLHSKYSLHPKQEWWKGDIKGMKVRLKTGEAKELDGNLYARTGVGTFVNITALTPYTPPTAQDIIAKHNLTEEEVRVIREGK
jgi:hypothetical protein